MADQSANTASADKAPPADGTTILHPNADGGYSLTSVSNVDIQRIDISDVDLLITLKNGDHFLLPGGGIAAMGEHPPSIEFSNGNVSAADLLGEVGAALDLAVTTPMPASFKIAGAKEGGAGGKEQELAQKVQKLEHKVEQQHEQLDKQHKEIEKAKKEEVVCVGGEEHPGKGGKTECKPHSDDNQQVAPLNANTSTAIDQLVQNLQQLEDALHNKDYDYIPPEQYSVPPAAGAPPPGVPPPISLTPIITLFMGNVVGTTTSTSMGIDYFYGGGGATGSDVTSQIGPRDALQWSAATITGDNNNDVIYAEGPLVGNADPLTNNTAYYAKQFLLNVAGYFTTLNNITIKGVPTGVTIVGTGVVNEGGGVWSLPKSFVLQQTPFNIVYQTSNYNANGNNTFTLEFDVSGTSTHGAVFSSVQTIEFEYLPVTNVNQVTNPELVYDAGGYTKEIYVLPTLDQPNIITAGDGNDTVYGSRSNDTITLGNGANTVTDGNGTDTITTGNGNSTIVAGSGNDTITVGTGSNSITAGGGNDTIVSGGGGGTISLGSGTNNITVNSVTGSTNGYTITATGNGSTTVNGGDDNYTITTGTGVDTIALGAGTDQITTSGGGGSITTGQGNQTITLNSTSGSKNNYSVSTSGSGTTSLVAGDDNYSINAGNSGANSISLGSGTSTVTAITGTGTDSVATGNGSMTIALGGGAGDNVTVGTSTSVANIVAISLGNGASDSVTLSGSASSSGTVAIGSGNSDALSVGAGNYTLTVGGVNGATNALNLTSGSGDTITAGAGNNLLYVGSSASGTDTVTLGNGNNTIYVGTGTKSITAGSGSNILNLSDLATAATVAFGTTGTSSATATGTSDSFTGVTTLYGTNNGDTITLNTGTLTVFGGSGNDSITLGSGIDAVYGGNGNNTIAGTGLTTVTFDTLYGGTGNNTFTTPDAGTTYNGTNGSALTPLANNLAYQFTNTSATNPFANSGALPADLAYSYSSGAATISLYLQTQINEVSYASASTTALTINLAAGVGSGTGGNATGSFYAFTPSAGYSSIDAVIGNNGTDTFTPSYDSSILIGGSTNDTFQDGNTLASQTIIVVGDNQASGTNTDVFYAGLASEIFIASKYNSTQLAYGWNSSQASAANSAGVVVNMDSTSHTFASSLFTGNVTVGAYSGISFGAVTATATGSSSYLLNVGTASLSWSAGDYYAPVAGTSTDITAVMGSNYYTNLIYGGSNNVTFYAGGSTSHGNFFFAGSGGSQYQMNGGWGAAVVLTSGGTNVFATHNDAYNNSSYNMYVILNRTLDTGAQASKETSVSLTWGGTTYTGFVYGWGGVSTPVGNPLTYISGYEDIIGYSGNDYIVGDNNGDQINAEAGSNTLILGDGTNIVTALQGSNTITDSTASGQTIGINTLNFESNNDANSGVLGSYSGSAQNTAVEAFLNYATNSTQSTFFGTGGDEAAFFGSSALASTYQARTGVSSFSYNSVQSAIIGTINGSDYTSNTAVTASSSSSFVYDNVYSGAKTIIGHAGNDVFIDNDGVTLESFNGSADKNNAYYITGAEIPDVTITGGGTAVTDILRIPGATSANLTTLVTDSASFTGVDVVDLRTGADTVSPVITTITMGAGSTAQTNSFALTEANMESLTHVAAAGTATLILKLDSGDTFTATPSSGNSIVHTSTAYFGDVYTFTHTANSTVTTLDIHYGTG